MPFKVEIHDRENSEEAKQIEKSLYAFNVGFHADDWRELTITYRNDSGEMVGGLTGESGWQWLFVRYLWVAESHRGQDLGTALMRDAEREARSRGCKHVWLDTFSFQARGFYEKLGYTVFGELKDFPPGVQRYFLRKDL